MVLRWAGQLKRTSSPPCSNWESSQERSSRTPSYASIERKRGSVDLDATNSSSRSSLQAAGAVVEAGGAHEVERRKTSSPLMQASIVHSIHLSDFQSNESKICGSSDVDISFWLNNSLPESTYPSPPILSPFQCNARFDPDNYDSDGNFVHPFLRSWGFSS